MDRKPKFDHISGHYPMGTLGIMGGVPEVPTPFAKSLTDIMMFNYEHALASNQNLKVVWAHNSLHSAARNYLAGETTGDFIVMLDTDHVHPADSVMRLVRAMKKYNADVVTGVYFEKDEPYMPQIWGWDNEDRVLRKALSVPSHEPFFIDAAGAGVLLIRKGIFARIRDEIGGGPFDIEPGVAEGASPFGEDLSFFIKLMRMDPRPRVVCLPSLLSNHLAWREIGTDDHREATKDMTIIRDDNSDMGKMVMRYGDVGLETKQLGQVAEAGEDESAAADSGGPVV